MPRNNKKNLVEGLIQNAAEELQFMNYSDSGADEIMEELDDNLAIISSFRYSYIGIVPKNDLWFESILMNYDAERFKTLLRVSRKQFDVILNLIQNHEVFNGRNSYKQFSTSFQLALVLYRLGSSGKGATVKKIASLFGVGDGGTIDRITGRVFRSLMALEKNVIKWPNEKERNEIVADNIEDLHYCIGYVDGSEIRLAEAPELDHTSYYSRCSQYSIKLQCICDPYYRIIHYVIGYPGSVHDAKIFSSSSIGRNPQNFFDGEQWIAGDSAYRLTTHVITPFRKNSKEETPERRRKFNRIFSKYRVRIEHCFGFLKEKFGSLKELRIRIANRDGHKLACEWIKVCCILHNILLPHLDESDWELFTTNTMVDEDEDEAAPYPSNIDKDAALKRKALADLILN